MSADQGLDVRPYIQLSWEDIQFLLNGDHPLTLVRMVLSHEAQFNPPTKPEVDDLLANAEHLWDRLAVFGLRPGDLEPMAADVGRLTHGLSNVSEDAIVEIVALAARKGLGRGVLRKKGLVDASMLKPIKRAVPLARGMNYGDPENKAFPLDTPSRVAASHAYLHKYWTSNGKSGITSSYGRDKFIEVHNRIMTRMRRLGIEHSPCDSLDRATRKMIRQAVANRGASKNIAKTQKEEVLSPDQTNIDEHNNLRNVIEQAFTDHVTFLKNYVSACDDQNKEYMQSMETALMSNAEEILGIVNEHLLTEDSDVGLVQQFEKLWGEYLDAVRSMIVGGDTGGDNVAKDGLRKALLVKDGIVRFFMSVLGDIAEQEKLDEAMTGWITYLHTYIDARDNDDYAASYQALKDWQKVKNDVAALLAMWIMRRDELEMQEMDAPKPLELEGMEPEAGAQTPTGPVAGGTQPGGERPSEAEITNPPVPAKVMGRPMVAANNIRRNVQAGSVKDSSAPSAAPAPASASGPTDSAGGYPPVLRRLNEEREDPIGHTPMGPDCRADSRTGKCYRKHDGQGSSGKGRGRK